ncbi:MAG: hypothetical protein ABIR71_12255 [Chthoniobacterales bacterium]
MMLILCSVALLLTSAVPTFAQSKKRTEKYGVYPIAYKEIITRWLGEQLIDPASAEIEWLMEPRGVTVKAASGETFVGYFVDFKVNSRNKFGMYTGKQARRVYIRGGEIISGGRVPK